MRRVLVQIGRFELRSFGAFIALGILAAILVGRAGAKHWDIDPDSFLDFSMWALLFGLAGARVAYVLTSDPAYFATHLFDVLKVDLGGLSIHGAILGGIVAGIWFSRRRNVSFWRLADIVAPGLILGQAIGRIGCDVFGYPMAKPAFWGVNVGGLILHPVQVYESVLDYLIFAFLWSRKGKTRYEGELFVDYLFLFSLARGLVEFFRLNPVVWGPFSIAHVASLALILAALVTHLRLRRLSTAPPAPADASKDWPARLTWLVTAAAATLSVVVYYAFRP